MILLMDQILLSFEKRIFKDSQKSEVEQCNDKLIACIAGSVC